MTTYTTVHAEDGEELELQWRVTLEWEGHCTLGAAELLAPATSDPEWPKVAQAIELAGGFEKCEQRAIDAAEQAAYDDWD